MSDTTKSEARTQSQNHDGHGPLTSSLWPHPPLSHSRLRCPMLPLSATSSLHCIIDADASCVARETAQLLALHCDTLTIRLPAPHRLTTSQSQMIGQRTLTASLQMSHSRCLAVSLHRLTCCLTLTGLAPAAAAAAVRGWPAQQAHSQPTAPQLSAISAAISRGRSACHSRQRQGERQSSGHRQGERQRERQRQGERQRERQRQDERQPRVGQYCVDQSHQPQRSACHS